MPLTIRATRARTAIARSLIGQVVRIKSHSILWYRDAMSARFGHDILNQMALYLYEQDCDNGWTITSLQSIAHTGFWTFKVCKKIKGVIKTLTLDDYYLEREFPSPPKEGILILPYRIRYGLNWNRTSDIIEPHDLRYWQKHCLKLSRHSASRMLLEGDAWPTHADNVAARKLKTLAQQHFKKALAAKKEHIESERLKGIYEKLKTEVGPATARLDRPPEQRKRNSKEAMMAETNAHLKIYIPRPIKRGFRGRRKVVGRKLFPIGEDKE